MTGSQPEHRHRRDVLVQRRIWDAAHVVIVPPKLELEQLIATIGARRERPIMLCPVSGRPVPCGMWIAADARDYIFFETDTSPLHQAHI